MLCCDVRRTYDSSKMRDSVHWTLNQAFNFAFQVSSHITSTFEGRSLISEINSREQSRLLEALI